MRMDEGAILLKCVSRSLQYISKIRDVQYNFKLMTSTKKVNATIEISSPYPIVENGRVVFSETTHMYRLNNILVPADLETSVDAREYFNGLLGESDCDIALIEHVSI